jgi:hypothetical protein
LPFLVPKSSSREIAADLGHGKKGGKTMMEKRNTSRVKVSHAIHYHKDTGPRFGVASTVDLSVGGVRIKTSHSLALGDVLRISLPIRSRVIECEGIVVHLVRLMGETLEAGIRFVRLIKHDSFHLARFVSDILAMEEDVLSLRGIVVGLGLGFLLWAGIIYVIFLLL